MASNKRRRVAVPETRKLAKAGTVATTAAARRANELLGVIARHKAQISEEFYEIGLALREMERKKLYVALGFSSFASMLEKRKVMSERSARKLIEVVGSVARETAIEVGSEKAYALARLSAAAPALGNVDDILAKGVRVGGKKTAVAKLSSDQIQAVARELRPKKDRPGERDARNRAADAQAALHARGAPHANVTSVRRGAKWWLVASLPLDEADALPRARK